MSSDATRDQPAPVHEAGAESAHDLVFRDLASRGDLTPALTADLLERKELGLARYGTILQPNNGRNSLVDAYQESLDLVAYLRNELERGADAKLERLYHDALDLLVALRERLP